MAIDLQNPTNIGTGWGQAPTFSAPSIGGLVGSILENRRLQQAQQQKEIADSIKQYQQGRGGAAFIKAAQSANLLPQGDLGDLGSQGPESAAALAKLIHDSQQTSQDKYYDLLTKQAGGSPRTWTDQFGNVHVLGPRGSVSAPLKPPQPEDTAAKLAKDVKAVTGGYSLSDIQGGLTPTYDPETGALTTSIPQMVKNKAGQFEKAVTLPDGTTAALSDVVAQQKSQYANLPGVVKQVTLPPDLSKRYRKLTDPSYTPPADATDTSGGGGGGPNDAAISKANTIKAFYQAGKITADEAKSQIQALGIPGLQ